MQEDLHDVKPKCFAYQGLVIAAAKNDSEQYNLVLLLQSEKENVRLNFRIYGVSSMAFIPPNVEKDFLKVEEAKNLQRRYSMPLTFGDIIQWNDNDCDHAKNIIKSFRRENPIYKVNSNQKGPLLRMGGVIDPSQPATFWTKLGSLSMPIQEALRAEPDVFLYAWIRIETKMNNSNDPVDLQLTFDHFDDFDESEQGKVSEAPWHKASAESKFTKWRAEPGLEESDDEIDVEPPAGIIKIENKWAESIRKQLGLFVGERLLICKDLSQYDFIIPLLTPLAYSADDATMVYPSVGEYFHFSAVWSNIHQSFLVTDIMPVVALRCHQVTPSGNLCVRVSLSPIKGLFMEHEETLGLIDDPLHCISFLEFHPVSYNKLRAIVEIRAVRSCENRSVRYRIFRCIPDDELMKNYYQWLEKNEITIGTVEGLLINHETVITAKHPNLYFRIPYHPGDVTPPVGSGIRFRAKRPIGFDQEALITDWHIYPGSSARKVIKRGGVTLFQLSVKAVFDQEQLAINDIVGPVDLRHHDHPNNSSEKYLVWARESPLVGKFRRASTILEVFSLGDKVPVVPESEQRSGRGTPFRSGSSSSDTSFNDTLSERSFGSRNSRSTHTSLKSSRFIGPTSSGTSVRSSCRYGQQKK